MDVGNTLGLEERQLLPALPQEILDCRELFRRQLRVPPELPRDISPEVLLRCLVTLETVVIHGHQSDSETHQRLVFDGLEKVPVQFKHLLLQSTLHSIFFNWMSSPQAPPAPPDSDGFLLFKDQRRHFTPQIRLFFEFLENMYNKS